MHIATQTDSCRLLAHVRVRALCGEEAQTPLGRFVVDLLIIHTTTTVYTALAQRRAVKN